MVYQCCVLKCRTGSEREETEKISVFKLPKDTETRRKWQTELERTGIRITKSSHVCEKHFTSEQIKCEMEIKDNLGNVIFKKLYKQKHLVNGAIPKLLKYDEISEKWFPLKKSYNHSKNEIFAIPKITKNQPRNVPHSEKMDADDNIIVPALNVTDPKLECIKEDPHIDLFHLLLTGKQVKTPNSTWGRYLQTEQAKYIMFSQSRNVNGCDIPYIVKKVVFYENRDIKVYLLNKNIELEDLTRDINSVEELERLLIHVNNMVICEGGPSVKLYSNNSARCCHKDNIFNRWRHVFCPVYLQKGGLICMKCASLENTLGKHIDAMKRHRKSNYRLARMLKRSQSRVQKLQDTVKIIVLQKKLNIPDN